VASFFLRIDSVARGAGRRATAAAAYRAGERIRDERTGDLHNYTRRRDVLHTEIFLPAQVAGLPIAWARNRERLWNMAEHAEKRHNARVAREYQVTLPIELDAGQRLALARAFAQEMAERYKVAVDLAVHEPRPEGDPRNFHAHLLTTTREVTPTGLGAKAGLDMTPLERRRHELPDHRQEYVNVRERWAILTNEALRAAHVAARVDHRSLAAQGIDREPRPSIPLMLLKMEQRGLRSGVAERLRANYRERVQRRQERAAERAVDERAAPVTRAAQVAATLPTTVVDADEVRRRAREAWLLLRSRESGKEHAPVHETGEESARAARERESLESGPHAADDQLAL
jgi:ATP-dependent exoDNAse (exonuclease V) alpha subunit